MTFSLPHEIGNVELVAHGREATAISGSAGLVLRGRLYAASDDAARIGLRVQNALLLAGAETRIGVDVGRLAPRDVGHLTKFGREYFAKSLGLPDEAQLLEDRFGLTVFEDTGRQVFFGIGPVRMGIGVPVQRFTEAVQAACERAATLGPKHLLALELFSAARFESSLRARFIALITVLETLAIREPKGGEARAFIAACQERLASSGLPKAEVGQMRSGLRELEQRSISASCRELVGKYGDTEAVRLFSACYRARGELLHAGRTAFDVPSQIEALEILVSTVLVSYREVEQPLR
ncbi:MAG: hypothetical protein ACJ796_10420 [Gemmatimonadaceae bacterium]